MRMTLRLLLVGFVASLVACGSSKTDFVCRACQTTDDCPANSVCHSGVCVSGDEDPKRCPQASGASATGASGSSSASSAGGSSGSSSSASSASASSGSGSSVGSSSGTSAASSSGTASGSTGSTASTGSSGSSTGGASTTSGSASSGSGSSSGSTGLGGWVAPIGVPVPDFGTTEQAPSEPSPWTDASSTNQGYQFYYVCPTCLGASDASNPFGTPGKPRSTIPSPLPGPAVVELEGRFDQDASFTGIGTAQQPIFVRAATSSAPELTVTFEPQGSFIILENLWFGPADANDSDFGVWIREGSDHIVIRNCEVAGNLNRAGGIGVGTWGYAGSQVATGIVIDNTWVHDLGDVSSSLDQDTHCISINGSADHVWVTHSQLQRCSGDAVQIEAQPGRNAFVNHIYYGLNQSDHNRQTGGAVKHASDVIFSQNVVHDFRPSSGGPGACYAMQYGPEYVWFIYNEGYNCDMGFNIGDNDPNTNGLYTFLIGNLIHDTGAASPGNVYSSGGISVRGGTNVYVVNNTLVRTDGALHQAPYGNGTSLHVINNIFAQRANPSITYDVVARSVYLEVSNNLFDASSTRFQVNNSDQYSLADFHLAVTQMGGPEQNDVSADPAFTDAASELMPSPTSAAVDQGALSDVYATFQARYGIDIRRDITGNLRPQGAAWDVGAYEQ